MASPGLRVCDGGIQGMCLVLVTSLYIDIKTNSMLDLFLSLHPTNSFSTGRTLHRQTFSEGNLTDFYTPCESRMTSSRLLTLIVA